MQVLGRYLGANADQLLDVAGLPPDLPQPMSDAPGGGVGRSVRQILGSQWSTGLTLLTTATLIRDSGFRVQTVDTHNA